ncbi:hypothetical protein OL548_33815 (plasmid) [Lysinibacillus sp. MHQ-1]|nr:hypothetical protein OL548_33815 [Lysinibacillus sp. MHQ-1]
MSTKQGNNLALSWLDTPPKTLVNPPIDTRIQELPFEKIRLGGL